MWATGSRLQATVSPGVLQRARDRELKKWARTAFPCRRLRGVEFTVDDAEFAAKKQRVQATHCSPRAEAQACPLVFTRRRRVKVEAAAAYHVAGRMMKPKRRGRKTALTE